MGAAFGDLEIGERLAGEAQPGHGRSAEVLRHAVPFVDFRELGDGRRAVALRITSGDEDAPEEEIIRAAKEAHAWSFIRRLPKGLDTVIDDSSLSQGQKQLLCISRVMLTMPPMLILDEATSSIDTRTELKIQNAFEKMMKGRTTFIVAHRLSTIRSADVILVMKDGHIVEQGSHEELLAAGGFYATLYASQFESAG